MGRRGYGLARYIIRMPEAETLHDVDFYAWALDQSAKLRAWPGELRPNGIDIANIAEELDALAAREERELRSLFRQIFVRLLKLRFHPAQENRNHWCNEVDAFRDDLLQFKPIRRGRGSPKLWSERAEWAAEAWPDPVERASRLLERDGVPAETLALLPEGAMDLDSQVLRGGWYPEYRSPSGGA